MRPAVTTTTTATTATTATTTTTAWTATGSVMAALRALWECLNGCLARALQAVNVLLQATQHAPGAAWAAWAAVTRFVRSFTSLRGISRGVAVRSTLLRDAVVASLERGDHSLGRLGDGGQSSLALGIYVIDVAEQAHRKLEGGWWGHTLARSRLAPGGNRNLGDVVVRGRGWPAEVMGRGFARFKSLLQCSAVWGAAVLATRLLWQLVRLRHRHSGE